MIREEFMRLGGFDVSLDPQVPQSIKRRIENYDQVVVTQGRLDGDLTRTTLTQSAIYRGVITGWSDRKTSLKGAGMGWFLGNERGLGPRIDWLFSAGRDWSDWLSVITTDSGWAGMIVAAVVDEPATTWPDASATDDGTLPLTTRDLVDELAALLGCEYYITPDGYFRSGGENSDDLFTVTTPTVILVRDHEGRDVDLVGLRVIDLDQELDYSQAGNGAYVLGSGGTAGSSSVGSGRRLPYNVNGTSMNHWLVEEDDSLDTGNDCFAKAVGLSNQLSGRELYRAVVDDRWPGRWMRPGDYLWVYDPELGIYDDTESTMYRGEFMQPARLRLYGMSWPIRDGMGVYRLAKASTDSPEIEDLTDYVLVEEGDVELSVGAPLLSLSDF